MREMFDEYGLLIIEYIGAAILIGLFFKIFWGGDSFIAPLIDQLLDCWM